MAQKQQQDEQQVAELVAKGVPPIKLVYDDGGGHESFRRRWPSATGGGSLAVDSRLPNRLGDVSRPEALAAGPREIVLDESGRPKQEAAIDRPGLRLGSGRAGSGHSSESDA